MASIRNSSLMSLFLATNLGVAQGARIVKPTHISKASHPIEVKPSLAGFRIGEPMEEALKRLSSPNKHEVLGDTPDSPVSYSSDSSGITLIGGQSEGVGIILLAKRDAGALDGIRVGDNQSIVKSRWGQPAAGSKTDGLWLSGPYVVTVSFDSNGLVTRLGIGLGQ